MHHTFVWIAGVGALTALSATASAQDTTNYFVERLAAPSEALELKIGTGYTQGFGTIAPGRGLPQVVGAGVGASVDLDYRMTPDWSFGIEAQYQEFGNEQNTSARGLAGNLGGTFHIAPTMHGDPWLRIGTGFRSLWENNPVGAQVTSDARFGFQAVTAKIGYDLRISEDFALAPVVGADLNVFVWNWDDTGVSTLPAARVGTFIYAGVQARFDLGGRREVEVAPPPVVVTSR